MYEQCITILWMMIGWVGLGFGSIIDIMRWVRYCDSIAGS